MIDPSYMVGDMMLSTMISVLVIVGIIMFFYWMLSKIFTESHGYRKLLVDMYIVGMIKKFAKEDNIDLFKELKEFNKLQRKQEIKEKAIDSVIADNLKEKINAKAEKDIERIEED